MRVYRSVLIFRYLAKEVFVTLTALTTILLLIFMSNQFVKYLHRAANGQFPVVFIMKLMMLELPNLMSLLLPLGFYMALMIAYGRLYAESEMTVLQACGYGSDRLLKHSLIMASLVAFLVLAIMLWVSPHIAIERARILRTSGIQTLIKTVVPGQFRALSNGRQVFYVESMNRSHDVAENVFLARLGEKEGQPQWDVLWAKKAFIKQDPHSQEDFAVLEQGIAYEGTPGHADYQVAKFAHYQARLPHPFLAIDDDVRTAFTSSLWPISRHQQAKAAELQWRLSIPLMVITLTLIGVPLSRVNPRTGKFAKLFPAILIYIIYANFMFVSRNWLISGKTPFWLGMWWLHVIFLGLGFALLWIDRKKLS